MKKLTILPAVAALAAFAWTPIAQGAPFDTFVVDGDGMATAEDCDSGEAADSSTINGAIALASDTTKANKRDVILVCPDEYLENVVVNKTVIVQGVGGVAADYATVKNVGNFDTITIESDGVKIDNLEIIQPSGSFDYPVVIESSDNEISHNRISGGDDGIRIEDGADGNSVHHNIIEGTLDDGISVQDSSGNDIHHNTITTLLGAGVDGEGIQLAGPDAGGDNAVHHNTITSVAEIGILVSSDNNDIHHNIIEGSGAGDPCQNDKDCVGIELSFNAADNSVHNNIVTGSVGNGISSEGDSNDINMNFVCDNNVGDDGGHDIEIFASAIDNRVLNNTAADIVDAGTDTVLMNNSDCPNG